MCYVLLVIIGVSSDAMACIIIPYSHRNAVLSVMPVFTVLPVMAVIVVLM